MVADVCPRRCGIVLHRTWPGEPLICRACGYEDYDSYQSDGIESQLTSDSRRRLGVPEPRTVSYVEMLPNYQRRYAEDSEWLRHNGPAIPLVYEANGGKSGRRRLDNSVCVAFKKLLEVEGLIARAIGDHYGVNKQTVYNCALRAE